MKILVVDDHPLIVQALEQCLPQLDLRLEVLGAVNREETLTALARYPECALVLLDLALPGARGLDLLVQLRSDFPHLPIVVLSATHDRATVGAALAAGARGYVSKTASADALIDAVRTVLSGGHGVTADVSAAPASSRSEGRRSPGLSWRRTISSSAPAICLVSVSCVGVVIIVRYQVCTSELGIRPNKVG
jgi:DNA-binding NarL/FixJ family response regulator